MRPICPTLDATTACPEPEGDAENPDDGLPEDQEDDE